MNIILIFLFNNVLKPINKYLVTNLSIVKGLLQRRIIKLVDEYVWLGIERIPKLHSIQNDDWMHNSIDLRRINFRNMEYYNENVTKQRNKLLNDEISLK